MKLKKTWMLYGMVALAAAGCMSAAEPDNDSVLPPIDSGMSTPPVSSPDASGPAPTPDAGVTPGAGDGGASDAGGGDAGGDAGGTQPPVSVAGTGTAAGCMFYTPPMGDKCYGKFCGVTAAQIDAALTKPRIGNCNLVTPELACKGTTLELVGKCARESKTLAPWKTPLELRPDTEACVRADPMAPDPAIVTPACLGCYLDSAVCSGDKCLVECLAGNSPDCDTCRERNGCNEGVAACAGFPDPR